VQASLSGQTAEQVGQLEAVTTARIESLQADQAGITAQLESRLDAGLSAVAKMTADGTGIRRTVHDIERRLMALFDRLSQQTTDSSAVTPSGPGEDQANSGLLSAHYVSFEDTFRGTRDDIKQRAGHYLAAFRDAGIEAGDGLVLDLGCGRGEWLEVLSEHGYACRGVDLNSVMVGEAQAMGLDAVELDAIAHLRSLDSESVAAVTSMHLVEHLPYEVLIRLVDEALRVLRPGGVLILETPNPENLTVGSYWFYMDPTHRNPIPPPLLQWVVEARGFEGAAIDRLTQNRGVFDIQPVGEDVAAANQINKIVGLLTAAPDYAIVARKPRSELAHGQGA
jgi:O-antigen chain-terminating methyltransferase